MGVISETSKESRPLRDQTVGRMRAVTVMPDSMGPAASRTRR